MKKITLIAAASMLIGSAVPALAVPARRDVRTVTQPDGTTLRIKKVGDERCHFTLTEDGLLLVRESDGTYCYARANAAGLVESIGLKAVDPELRSVTPALAMRLDELDMSVMARSPRRIPQSGIGIDNTSFPSKGSPNVLILLVEYADYKFNLDDPRTYFEGMLNKPGFDMYGGTGSCKDYFMENSMGQFTPHFDIYGPVVLPQDRSYYGGNDMRGEDMHPEEMVIDAIKILDPDVDFSKYDNDGDGKLDNVYLIYAGQGEASNGPEESVWPHSWDLSKAGSEFEVDGVTVDHYACSNEWVDDRPDGIGTFVHEFSHVLGLPDLYCTNGVTADWTPDMYSVLDYGPYNNDGCTPPAYGLFERNALGWIDLDVIDDPMDCELEHVLKSNKGYLIPTSRTSEFFLLENRQQEGWDKYIPGHGMLIWHIDFNATQWANNTVNNNRNHQYVDIEEAGCRVGINESIQSSYTFPGNFRVTEFTDDTTPSMRSWSGERLGMPLTHIAENDGIITFLAGGGSSMAVAVPVPFGSDRIETGSDYFVAAWEPVANAVDYEVSVYAAGVGGIETASCDMGSDKTLSLPQGWTASSTDIYSSDTNYGVASPSMKLAKSGAYVLTPEFEGTVASISYWRKGQNTNGSELAVTGLVDNTWVPIFSEQPESGIGEVIEIADIPEGVRQVRFEYTKDRGNLAIDDIVVGIEVGDRVIDGYKDVSSAGQTSLRVDRLEAGCDTYRFKVRAVGENRTSRYSDLVTVKVEGLGVSGVTETGDAAEYFDMLGRRVLVPSVGDMLIERRGGKARKVVIR